jgi:2-succinyl-6-hydroxy-2,4-cyclohexadiene-1-carboxylate synthase
VPSIDRVPPFRRVRIDASDGLSLSVRVGGNEEGATLVLLHGFTGSAEAWGEPLLQALAGRYRVIAPDLPGHGASAGSVDPARYRLDAILQDLASVQRALINGAATWLGYSMGGRIALAAAVRGALPMNALILESASPGLDDEAQRRVRVQADESWAERLRADGLEAFVDAWMAQPLFRTQRGLAPEIRARERARRLNHSSPHWWAACLRGLGTGVQPAMGWGLRSVRVPVLLMTGTADEKFERIAHGMAGRLPRAEHVSYPGVGHAIHLEAPDAWVDAVTAFMDRRGATPNPRDGG